MNNQRWRNAGLYALLAIVVIALGTLFFDNKHSQTKETWKYSQFIQEVKAKKVERVSISSDRTKAEFTSQDGNKAIVNLPNDPELIDILTKNNVDITVMPQADEGFWLRAMSSLFFPIFIFFAILLLAGLFFLLRSDS